MLNDEFSHYWKIFIDRMRIKYNIKYLNKHYVVVLIFYLFM